MSGIDNIIQKINEDNQAKIKKLQDDTAIQIEEIKTLEDQKAQDKINKIEVETSKKIEEIESNAKSAAQMEAKKQLLGVRQGIMNQAFDNAKQAMEKHSDAQKTQYVKALVLQNANGTEKIVANKSEGIFTDALLSDLNSALSSAGKKGNLSYEFVEAPMQGFILKSGGMQIDLTYGSVVEQLKDQIDTQVSKILFEI